MKAFKDDNERLQAGVLLDEDEGLEEVSTLNPIDEIAPTLGSSYGLASLEADENRELIKIANLPPWPVRSGTPPPAAGHGLGQHLSSMLGHGLRPGEMFAIGAASAGAGKTAWLMQLVDGLALRNVRILNGETQWGKVLTPILIASEMSADALSWRSLSRWTGYPASTFRAGRTLLEKGGQHAERAREAWTAAKNALQNGDLVEARQWIRLANPLQAGEAAAKGSHSLVQHLSDVVSKWTETLAEKHKREIVPIIVLDPLQRFQSGNDEISDLNALSRSLCSFTISKSWITLVTSDTNKGSAKGEARGLDRTDIEEGAAIFRGSYNLMHEVNVALYLRKPPNWHQNPDEERTGTRHLEAVIVKQRWGGTTPLWPRYTWDGPTMRFYPMLKEHTEKLTIEEMAKRSEEGKGKNGSATPSKNAEKIDFGGNT